MASSGSLLVFLDEVKLTLRRPFLIIYGTNLLFVFKKVNVKDEILKKIVELVRFDYYIKYLALYIYKSMHLYMHLYLFIYICMYACMYLCI